MYQFSGPCLSQSPGLTLRFEEAQDIILADWALYVANNGASSIVHKFDADLSDTTTGTGTSEDAGDLDKLDRLLGCVHVGEI